MAKKFIITTRGFWFRNTQFVLVGGPFMDFAGYSPTHRRQYYGICLKAEATPREQEVANLWVPIVDFSVPTTSQIKHSLEDMIHVSLTGTIVVYVGCMGGVGRTGLILAMFTALCGAKDPLTYVRANYNPHAVETREQEELLRKFMKSPEFKDLRNMLSKGLWRKRLSALFGTPRHR